MRCIIQWKSSITISVHCFLSSRNSYQMICNSFVITLITFLWCKFWTGCFNYTHIFLALISIYSQRKRSSSTEYITLTQDQHVTSRHVSLLLPSFIVINPNPPKYKHSDHIISSWFSHSFRRFLRFCWYQWWLDECNRRFHCIYGRGISHQDSPDFPL
jgi:hypothetical protein